MKKLLVIPALLVVAVASIVSFHAPAQALCVGNGGCISTPVTITPAPAVTQTDVVIIPRHRH